MRNLIALLLIVSCVGIFFGYIKPGYGAIQDLQNQEATYKTNLSDIDTLNSKINDYSTKVKHLNPDDIARLDKFIPSTIDTVRLIIDINNIASNFGLSIKGITVDQPSDTKQESAPVIAGGGAAYGSVNISFDVTCSYQNFLSFVGGLEKSLRLVDIVNVTFSPTGDKSSSYDFHITLRTYWLK